MSALGIVWAAALQALVSCGGNALDLGHDATEGSRYATPDTVAAEADAGPGVPTLIAAHQYGGRALALDETRVYWTTGIGSWPRLDSEFETETTVVRSCAKTNCAATLITYATHQGEGSVLAVGKTHVYWLRSTREGRAIVACPVTGCAGPPTVLVPHATATTLVVDETHLYWLSSDDTLLKCPLEGCAGPPTLVAIVGDGSSRTSVPGGLAVDAANLYWVAGPGDPGGSSASIMTVAKDGSSQARAIAAGLHSPHQLAVDGTHVYWPEHRSVGAIKACPTTGCIGEPLLVASEQTYPYLFGVDGQQAYWMTSVNGEAYLHNSGSLGRLVECPLTGCASNPVVLAAREDSPQAIAIDSTHVYWTSLGETKTGERGIYYDGAVKRIRRGR